MRIEEQNINWKEIGLSNDFFFGKVMRNPDLCKKMLERILPELNIGRIEYPELQKTIKNDIDARGIRLDVYVKDSKEVVYDIEIQQVNTKELPQRSRYYQSMMDLQLIDAGQTYKNLNRSYVIFICLNDIFGLDRHKYTFENLCLEDTSIRLNDKTTKIFLNANGKADDVSSELKAFLDYVAGRKNNDPYVEELEKALNDARNNREWRYEYMTLLMRDQENQEIGKEIGKKIGKKMGETMLRSLIEKLIADRRFDDIEKMAKDEEYLQELYEEYHMI